MRPAVVLLVAVATLVVATREARATTGGQRLVEVLGHDVRDGKVYYLVRDYGGADAPPQVFFMHLDGDHAGVAVRARSYGGEVDDDDAARAALDRRIAALTARLAPVRRVAGTRTDSGEGDGQTLPAALAGFEVERQVVRRWLDETAEVPCRQVTLTVRREALSARLSVRECGPRARVTGAFAMAGREPLLTIVSSKPDGFEGGYEVQVPVLLRR